MTTDPAAPPIAVLAGASGFIGTALADDLAAEGWRIRRIGRDGPDARWGDPEAIRRAVDGAELVVNLAGKSVNCRYTDANRDELLRSRVETTRELREAIAAVAAPPRLWCNASTATIYRDALDRPMTESDHEIGAGLSADIARNWERELFADELPVTRRVAMRITIVLGDGPAPQLLLRLARFGLGGPQIDHWWPAHRRYRGIGPDPSGSGRSPWHDSRGRQLFSWIHLDDVIGAIKFVRDRDDLAGPINFAAPDPVGNRELMRELRDAVGAPFGLPAPRAVLEPAMWALRTEPELVLKSRWVLPERLLAAGYEFRVPTLRQAVRSMV